MSGAEARPGSAPGLLTIHLQAGPDVVAEPQSGLAADRPLRGSRKNFG
jgi:hypothetical protein